MSELDKQSYLLGFTDGREQGVTEGTIRGLEIVRSELSIKNKKYPIFDNDLTFKAVISTINRLIAEYQDKK